MGCLSLRFLGPPEIRHDGCLIALPTRKTLALLVYLLVEGGGHSREKLAALLWPDSDEDRSRASLRRTLAYLRASLAGTAAAHPTPHVIAERGLIRFDVTAPFESDERALARASTGIVAAWRRAAVLAPDLAASSLVELHAVAEGARGEFLLDFSLDDAVDFDRWVDVQRERSRRQLQEVYACLSDWQIDRGDLVGALATAGRWVKQQEWNEVAYRRLMEVHVARGEPRDALQTFESCRSALASLMDGEPTEDTRRLAARIRSLAFSGRGRRSSEPAHAPVADAGGELLQSELPLIGRTAEHARLVAAYQAASRGATRAVIVEGEAGIGKTRLATAFAVWAAARGAEVISGRTFEAGGTLPFQPIVDALRPRLESENAPDDLLGDVWLGELTRLLPELRERYPDLPLPLAMGDPEGRLRLFEAVSQLGQQLARRGPIVFLIDDLQWANSVSRDDLQYLGRRWSDQRVPAVLLLVVRSEDVTSNPTLARWLAAIAREASPTRFRLGPLSAAEARQLVKESVGLDFDAEESNRHLFSRTGGHPLFLIETARALHDAMTARGDPTGRLGLEVTASPDIVVPGVRDVIRTRLSYLGAPSRAMLFAAAVLARSVEVRSLCMTAGVDENEGIEAIEELLGRRLLELSAGPSLAGAITYVFTHDLLREVVYTEGSVLRRRVYHRRAFEVLRGSGAPAAELAYHARQAGLDDDAFLHGVRAGQRALELSAVGEAIAHYEQALAGLIGADAIQSSPSSVSDFTTLSRPCLELGRAYELVDNLGKARSTYASLLNLARRRGETEVECTTLNRLATLAAHGSPDLGAATHLLDQARTVASASGNDRALAETEWNQAHLSHYSGRLEDARRHGYRALALARRVDHSELTARSLNELAYAVGMLGDWGSAETYAEQATMLYVTLGDRAMETDSRCFAAESLILQGWTAAGLREAKEAAATATTIGNAWLQSLSGALVALGLVETGAWDDALRTAEQAVAIARGQTFTPLLLLTLGVHGAVQRSLFRVDEALATHREAAALHPKIGTPLFGKLPLLDLCADYASAMDWDGAIPWARRGLDEPNHASFHFGLTWWYQTEALLRGGHLELAIADVEKFDALAGGNRRFRIPVLRSRAVLALWVRNMPLAIKHLSDAADLAQEMTLPGELWPIESALGAAYRTDGQADHALHRFRRAAAIVHQLAERIQDEGRRQAYLTAAPVRHALDGAR